MYSRHLSTTVPRRASHARRCKNRPKAPGPEKVESKHHTKSWSLDKEKREREKEKEDGHLEREEEEEKVRKKPVLSLVIRSECIYSCCLLA